MLRFCVVIALVLAICPVRAESLCDVAPEGVTTLSLAGKSLKWTGDFNRDQVADRAELVSVLPTFNPSAGIVLANLWEGKAGRIPKTGETVGLLVTHGERNGGCKRYVLVDQAYFETSIWTSFLEGHDVSSPIGLVKVGSQKFKKWKRDVPSLKGDGIELYTEAGIENLLYWTNGHYEVFWPDEEP